MRPGSRIRAERRSHVANSHRDPGVRSAFRLRPLCAGSGGCGAFEKARGFRRLHGEGRQGLERPRDRRRHRRRRTSSSSPRATATATTARSCRSRRRRTVPIASNTKLFTAVAAGLLVEEGKLDWDKPVRQFVPGIQFYDDDLNATVTIRDMLSHRTGITRARHDLVQVRLHAQGAVRAAAVPGADAAAAADVPLQQHDVRRRRLRDRAALRQDLGGLRPRAHLRAARHDEHGRSPSTTMMKQPDHGVPFTERRDSFELYQIPYYREAAGIGPAGAINSNLEDMSRWLIALLNEGKLDGKAGHSRRRAEGDAGSRRSRCRTRSSRSRGCGELLNAGLRRRAARSPPTAATSSPTTAATSPASIRRSR